MSDGQAALSLWPSNVLPIDFFKYKAFNRLQILFSNLSPLKLPSANLHFILLPFS